MADLVITAANVTATGRIIAGIAGEAIGIGKPVYKNASGVWMLASAAADPGNVDHGVVVTGAVATGQRVLIATGAESDGTLGTLNLGAILTTGGIYVVSATAGGIAPLADLATGNYLYILGWASSTSVLQLLLRRTGTQLP